MVHRPPRIAQQRRHPAVAVAPILLRQCDDVLRQRLVVIRPARHFTLRRPMLPQHPAGASFGHPDWKLSSHMVDAASSSLSWSRLSCLWATQLEKDHLAPWPSRRENRTGRNRVGEIGGRTATMGRPPTPTARLSNARFPNILRLSVAVPNGSQPKTMPRSE